MNKKARIALWCFLVLILIVSIIYMYFVFAAHVVTTISGVTSTSHNVNEDVQFIYNITIYNQDAGQNANITQVNITLPNTFNFIANSNITNASSVTFTNTSSVLSWSNFSGYVVNGNETRSFRFNATASTPGNYNITVITVNGTGVFSSNITVAVNDTSPNITSDKTVYSCWQDSASTQGCSALINLTVSSTSPLANQIWNVTLNNTATASGIRYEIEWKNSTGIWINQSENNTYVGNGTRGYNLTTATHQFRINITMPSSLSTKWNISFNINGTNYILDPYLDSINLTGPVSEVINSTNQAPDFSFVLYSNNWTTQSCNLSLRVNDTGSWTVYRTNSSVTNGSLTTIKVNSNISEANYTWKISCNVSGDSASRWIYINDTINPVVTTSVSSITSSGGSLSATISETASFCNHSGAGSAGSLTNTSGTRTSWSATLSGLSASTSYNVTVTCNDTVGNTGSRSYNFTTSATTTTDDGTSSPGGTTTTTFWKAAYTISNKQFEEGYTKDLAAKYRIKVNVSGEDHYIGVISLTSTTATINVSSTPQQAVFSVGDIKKFDVLDDNYYDISVKLNSIASSKANLTVKSIHEKVPEATALPGGEEGEEGKKGAGYVIKESKCVSVEENATYSTLEECETELKKKPSLWWLLILIGVLILIVIIVIIFTIKSSKKKKWLGLK